MGDLLYVAYGRYPSIVSRNGPHCILAIPLRYAQHSPADYRRHASHCLKIRFTKGVSRVRL